VSILSAVPSSTATKLENLGSINSVITILFSTPSQQKVVKGEIQANPSQILNA
jgi:hypothetical protein